MECQPEGRDIRSGGLTPLYEALALYLRRCSDAYASYRRGPVSPDVSRALGACADFRGDVLIVESERDTIIPHQTITNFREAFEGVRSLTYRVIAGADHALSERRWQEAYTTILLSWATEMVLGERAGAETPQVLTEMRPLPQRKRATGAEG